MGHQEEQEKVLNFLGSLRREFKYTLSDEEKRICGFYPWMYMDNPEFVFTYCQGEEI